MTHKDSREVVMFMSLFQRLKTWCDDLPRDVIASAQRDDSIKDLCIRLWWAASDLSSKERQRREQFASPVDPKFIQSWRDYENRYASPVASVAFSSFLADLNLPVPEPSSKQSYWQALDENAREQSDGIEEAIAFARFNVEDEHRWSEEQQGFIRKVEDGIYAWERLKSETGFDLRGVFRRRALVPFVLVPRHVSAGSLTSETLLMLRNLRDAHEAFVFGASYAALALMRAIMEAMLRDHYGAKGEDLKALILNARDRLPNGLNEARLHHLRKLANSVLHSVQSKELAKIETDDLRFEKEIVSLLLMLRSLIESAPVRSAK